MDDFQFGALIRNRRQALHLSAAAVARAVGITPAYLSMLETGRNPTTKRPPKPSIDVAARLAAVLDLDVSELTGAGSRPSNQTKGFTQARWAPVGASSSRRPHQRAEKPRKSRRAATPPEVRKPSGILGVDIRASSHVLLLSASRSGRDVELTLDFSRAGLRNEETSVIRLPPEWTAAQATARFAADRGLPLNHLVLRPWQDSVEVYYRPHRFSRQEAIAAHRQDLRVARERGLRNLRYVSSDASAYLRWLREPNDVRAVLDYETLWPRDIRQLWRRHDLVLLCLYRMHDIAAVAGAEQTVTSMVVSLLESHGTVIFLTEQDEVLSARQAVRAILGRLDLRQASQEVWHAVGRIATTFDVWDAA